MRCGELVVFAFHLRNVFSTLASTQSFPQNLFSHFASTRLNMSAADITRICKWKPSLQKLQTLDNVEQFVNLLKTHGCSEVQIAKIMFRQPSIITVSVERILEPKINLLEDFGFEGESLAKLLESNPSILGLSLENDLLPKMDFLKNLFQSQQSLIKVLVTSPFILNSNLEKTLKPSVVFWEGRGFQGTELLQLIRIQPTILRRTSLTPAQADLIQEICADKESSAYKYIVSRVAVGRLETLKAKIENLKLCGLSVEETWQLCRARPQVLTYSTVRISEMMNFVVKDLEIPANYVVKNSYLWSKNIEKILRPRFLVWQKIKSMNGPSLSLSYVLKMSEARFIRNIIGTHPESTILWTIYENAISRASSTQRA